jgi:hypothetical protein
VLADLDTRTSGAPVTVLDVGVGTATALVRNREAILGGKTRFVGVDYQKAQHAEGRVGRDQRDCLHSGYTRVRDERCKAAADLEFGVH